MSGSGILTRASSIIVLAKIVVARAAGEGGHDLGGRVGEELHVAVGEDEIGAAWLQAPVVEHVALVVDVARTEVVAQRKSGCS